MGYPRVPDQEVNRRISLVQPLVGKCKMVEIVRSTGLSRKIVYTTMVRMMALFTVGDEDVGHPTEYTCPFCCKVIWSNQSRRTIGAGYCHSHCWKPQA